MSIIFIIICFVILIVVLAAISSPFWKKDPTTPELISQEAAEDQERADLSVEREVLRQSLQELDVELAQGRLEQEDYDRLKATDERRLIDVLDRLEALAATQTHESSTEQTKKTGTAWGSAIATSLIVEKLSLELEHHLVQGILRALHFSLFLLPISMAGRRVHRNTLPGNPGSRSTRSYLSYLLAQLRKWDIAAHTNDTGSHIRHGALKELTSGAYPRLPLRRREDRKTGRRNVRLLGRLTKVSGRRLRTASRGRILAKSLF